MSQHDGVIADQDGAAFLADLNAFIAAYLSRFSGTSDPATLVAYQKFIRTDLGVAFRRNAANSGNLLDGTLAETLVVPKSGAFTAGLADYQRTFICTGTWSMAFAAAATLRDGWWCAIKNDGAGVITLNPDGAETIDGAATLDIAAGQSCVVCCDGVALYVVGVLGISQADADARYRTTARKSQLSAEFDVNANALTTTINPCVVDFRSATLTTGLPNTRTLAAAASLVVPAGATLGSVANVPLMLIAGLIDNAGTLEPFIINQVSGIQLDESGVISTTAMSVGADSANVAYSETARTNVPYVLCGACVIAESTPGTWATQPTEVIPAASLFIPAIYDNTGATTDRVMRVRDKVFIDVAAATSIPLHIATASGQMYRISGALTSTQSAAGAASQLQPNNSTYASAFTYRAIYSSGTSALGAANTASAFYLDVAGQSPNEFTVAVFTETARKRLLAESHGRTTGNSFSNHVGGEWDDTTTLYTSLGTLTVPIAATGRIIIERVL